MLIYAILILISLICFLYYQNEKNQKFIKIVFYLFMILFTVISAIRYNVGTDYKITYVKYFNVLKSGGNFHYEFLFLYLNKIIIFFNGNYKLLFAICSLVTIPSFFRFIYRNVEKKYWFLSILLFIISTIYFATMNVIRQYMAIAILLYGYDFLKQNKNFKYLTTVVIAMLFHTSAIIAILIPILNFINKDDRKNKILIIFYFISLIFIFFDISGFINLFEFILPERYDYYINSVFATEKNMGAIFKIIIPNLILLISFKYKKELLEKKEDFNLIFYAWYIYVIISNSLYGINIFIRLGWYFEYYILLIVPLLYDILKNKYIELFNKKFNYAKVFLLIVIIFYVALTIYSIFLGGGHGVVPYKTIF